MRVRLTRRYRFSATHQLDDTPGLRRCSGLHGHRYVVELTLESPCGGGEGGVGKGSVGESGVVMAVESLDVCVRPVLAELEGRCLNELPGDPGDWEPMGALPTLENVARYLARRLRFLSNDGHQRLCALRVFESDDLFVDAILE
jgi:6-pyruvoyltetrahydropterin/6-carboxytetrahydropterin synthase